MTDTILKILDFATAIVVCWMAWEIPHLERRARRAENLAHAAIAHAQGKDITAHLIHLRQDDKE